MYEKKGRCHKHEPLVRCTGQSCVRFHVEAVGADFSKHERLKLAMDAQFRGTSQLLYNATQRCGSSCACHAVTADCTALVTTAVKF